MAVNRQQDSGSIKYLDKEIIESYRKWRKNNRFGFYIEENMNELTYRDGAGMIKQNPRSIEYATLTSANYIVFYMLIFYTALNVIGNLAAPQFLNDMSLRFGADYFRHFLRGNELKEFLFSFIFNIISRAIPLFIILKIIKMPLRVMLPHKTQNRSLVMLSIPAAAMNTAICFVLNQFYLNILYSFGINSQLTVHLPKNPLILTLTLISEIIIIPIMGEMILRGTGIQLFRQFGDGYAIFVTAFISAVCTFDLRMVFCVFVNSVLMGYFTLRTGSIIPAILMRITIRGLSVVLIILSSKGFTVSIAAVLLICLISGMAAILYYRRKYNDRFALPPRSTYLTTMEKLENFIICPPAILFFAFSFAVMLFSVPLRLD